MERILYFICPTAPAIELKAVSQERIRVLRSDMFLHFRKQGLFIRNREKERFTKE